MKSRHIANAWIAILVTVLITACGRYKHKFRQSSITMEKTPCFGMCPIYEMTIQGNGQGYLNNKRFTKTIGEFKHTFSPDEVEDLFDQLSEMDWTSYKDEYPTDVTDLPGTRLHFVHKKIDKQVYVPGGAEIPENLESLIRQLEKIAEQSSWAGVEI